MNERLMNEPRQVNNLKELHLNSPKTRPFVPQAKVQLVGQTLVSIRANPRGCGQTRVLKAKVKAKTSRVNPKLENQNEVKKPLSNG